MISISTNEEGNKIYSNYLYEEYIEETKKGIKSIVEIFEESCIKNSYLPFLGKIYNGEVLYETYSQVFEKVRALTTFLIKNVKPRSIIGICCQNSPDWIIIDHAIMRSDCITLPIYTTFGNDTLNKIIEETELDFLFLSTKQNYLLKSINRNIKNIILIEEDITNNNIIEEGYNLNNIINEYLKEQIIKDHININKDIIIYPNINSIASICYTSGTTSLPKGVEITHKNLGSVMMGYKIATKNNQQYEFTNIDRYVSYLPLSHIFERMIIFALTFSGSSITFFNKDKKYLQSAFQLVKPTMIAGVPKVFENIKNAIINQIPWLIKPIFNYLLNRKNRVTKSKDDPIKMIGNILFFKKIKKKFGGHVKFFLSGSAPLSPDLHNFMQNAFDCDLYQGYGLTETMASVFCCTPFMNHPGTVGIPFVMNKILFKKELNGLYQLCIKGDHVFKGYYKNSELTKNSFIGEYFKTGDYGETEKGLFKIIGREKNLFKSSLGEFIIPEKIEEQFEKVFREIYITGDPYISFIVAIVYSNDSKEEVLKKINKHALMLKEQHLMFGFQVPKDVFIVKKSFQELGLLNPTGKVVRERVEELFKEEIANMLKKIS